METVGQKLGENYKKRFDSQKFLFAYSILFAH